MSILMMRQRSSSRCSRNDISFSRLLPVVAFVVFDARIRHRNQPWWRCIQWSRPFLQGPAVSGYSGNPRQNVSTLRATSTLDRRMSPTVR